MTRRSALGAALLLSACARRPAAPAAPVSAGAGALAAFVAPDAARASAAGASAASIVASGAAAPGDSLGARLEVADDACVLLLARGGPTIDDLDLFAYADDGSALGVDETAASTASVIVCPPHPRHLYAFARVASGHGLLALSAQTFRPADEDRIAVATGARGRLRTGPVTPSLWPGLEETLAEHRRAIGGTWHEIRRVAVPLDPRAATRLSAVLEAGQCVDAFAEPSDEVALTELSVMDAEGRILAQIPADRRRPDLVVCAPAHAEVTFSLRPHGGRGLAAVVLSVSTDAAPGRERVYLYEASDEQTLASALQRRDAELAKRGLGAPKAVLRGETRPMHRQSLSVDLDPGCTRFDVLAGAPLRGLDAFLWSDAGQLVDRDAGPGSASLFGCTAAKTPVRLDVEATTRAGPFAVEARPGPSPSPLLAARPLAGARFLRLLSLAAPAPGAPEVSSISVSAASLVRRDVTLGATECATFLLALDAGSEGAELRVLDVDTEDELGLERRYGASSVDVCAMGRPRRLRLEVRIEAGSGEALLGILRRNQGR